MNLLIEAGFTFAFRPLLPHIEWPWRDRGVWVADTRPAASLQPYTDPDPRPAHHEQFGLAHMQRPGNPATKALY
jgi:hypothetical protein